MKYEVRFSKAADKELRKLGADIRARIIKAAMTLSAEPRPVGVVKLEGPDGLYRIRIGDHRVIYAIHDDVLIVLVLRIADRKDVYRRGLA